MARGVRRAAAANAFYYDGSSTDSEPLDPQERRSLPAAEEPKREPQRATTGEQEEPKPLEEQQELEQEEQ